MNSATVTFGRKKDLPQPDTKVEEFIGLLQYPEVQECLKEIISNCMHESAIFIRLDLIEENLGADEFHCVGRDIAFERGFSKYDEEREPLQTIMERIAQVYKAFDTMHFTGETKPALEINTLTDIRVRLLLEKLESIAPRFGERYMTSKEVGDFIQNEIDEEFRYDGKGNPREVRSKLMKYAVKKFPTKVKMGKSKKGNRLLRIEFIG